MPDSSTKSHQPQDCRFLPMIIKSVWFIGSWM